MQTYTKKIEFLASCFGKNYNVSRSGKNISVQCPNCSRGTEKKKLSICLDTWICHCWVCSIKGKTPYKIIKEHISADLAQKFKNCFMQSINLQDDDDTTTHVEFPGEFHLLASFDKSHYDPDIRDMLHYLNSRGVTKEKMWLHKIGFFKNSMWARRIVFPSFDKTQNLNFYVTRAIDDDAFLKYRNCKVEKGYKTQIIFDEIRIDWQKELTVVEGVFDMIKCGNNTTCLLGSSLRSDHELFKKIIREGTPVLLALDPDMREKSFKIAKDLASYGTSVRLIQYGGSNKDIGDTDFEIVRQKCKEAPIYSRESRLQHLIGTINSGSIF